MTVEIKDGWMYGTLTDDKGKAYPVSRVQQAPTGSQHGSPVNLVLHTTETDGLVGRLEYPSNFQCGEGRIVQHIKLGWSGDAVWTYDRDCIGIEMVGRSKVEVWLPGESTLGPTVALVRWLEHTGRIKTATKRPRSWPDKLDQLPAAVTGYYRRMDPTTAVGVFGHVDLNGGNSHWDPGSFDYTEFFKRVSAPDDQGDEMAFQEFKKGWKGFLSGDPKPTQDGDEQFGWLAARGAVTLPTPHAAGPHHHDVKVLGRTFETGGEVSDG